MKGEAFISPCGQYRYTLCRELDSNAAKHRTVLFIMLNPSTADSIIDDPTIRRCMSFARREGFTRLTIVNLYALRSTNPKNLELHPDPVGPENNIIVLEQIKCHDTVIAAWGANKFAKTRAAYITFFYGPFKCLGKTKDGSPRHPLYIKLDQPLEDL